MAENPCLPQVHGIRMRVAILALDGAPAPGVDNMYVSRAFTSIEAAPTYTDGNEIDEPAADGVSCVNYKSADTFKRLQLTISLCTPDPFLQAMLSGGTALTGFDGDRVGYSAPALGEVDSTKIVSVEAWARRVLNGTLDADSPYAHHAYPKVTNLRLGNWTHNNGALLPSFVGQGYENPNWADGPANDWLATSDRVHQWVPTATLPDVACGPLELVAS